MTNLALDRFDTPAQIAAAMVNAVSVVEPELIADFAAGGGVLLSTAEGRWPSATLLAADLDESAVRELRRARPDWLTARSDFMNVRSRASSKVLRTARGRVSVVFLNPPYSCRGARRVCVEQNDLVFECGTALAFVFEALKYLAQGGELIAVIPAGSLGSEKDASAWMYLRSHYDVAVAQRFGARAFPRCVVRTAIVRLRARTLLRPVGTDAIICGKVDGRIIRGRLPMHRVRRTTRARGVELIHTSHLREGLATHSGVFVRNTNFITGPAVLLPRVGSPVQGKIVVLETDRMAVLSDCVMALSVADAKEAQRLRASILARWQEYVESYGGTCAPYLTLQRLGRYLTTMETSGAGANTPSDALSAQREVMG